jgi:hypothetical protein
MNITNVVSILYAVLHVRQYYRHEYFLMDISEKKTIMTMSHDDDSFVIS